MLNMKKYIIIVIVCIAMISIGAVVYGTGIMSKKPIYNENTEEYELIEDYENYINSTKLSDESKSFDNIPVYNHNEILHDNQDVGFFLGRDAGVNALYNSRTDFSKVIFTALPTEAIREVSKSCDVYTLYDTEIGIRLYLFFSKDKNNYMTLDGFPVIMQKKLDYKDFENINVGDRIYLVEVSTRLYRNIFDSLIPVRMKHLLVILKEVLVLHQYIY